MKTIKIILFIIMTIMINDKCMSYKITVTNICASQDNPTPFYYPSGNINVNYRIDSIGIFDRGYPRCKIYLVQGNNEILMFNEIVPKGVYQSTPLNPENLPGLQYNEPVKIKIAVASEYIPALVVTRNFYFLIYKDGVKDTYGSLSNGVSEIIQYNNFTPFFSSDDCESAASASYFVNQYKLVFTLTGNFTDSIPELVVKYSLGYNGAMPNPQTRWAYVISRTDTEIKIVTYVYELKNILGQELGFVPCRPEEARVVYRFVGTPHINSIVSFPAILTPSNNIALLKANLSGYYDSTQWSDSNNIHNHVLTPHGSYAVLNANLQNSDSSRVEWYSIHLQAFNQHFSSNKYKYRPLFGSDPHGCPALGYEEKGYKLIENHLLSTALANPNSDVTDYYKTYNPFNEEKDTITFSISEKGYDVTKINLLKMYRIESQKNTEAAVTVDGEVFDFINDSLKNKVLTNSGLDVSEQLRSIDNITYILKKDSALKIIAPPGDDNFIVIRGRAKLNKNIVAFRVNTSVNEISDVYFRELPGDVCIKLDKKNFSSFNITAFQDCEIDRIALVKNLNTHIITELKIIRPTEIQVDYTKLIAFDDDKYFTIKNGDDVDFSFLNNKNPEKESNYFIKVIGTYTRAEDPIKENVELSSNGVLEFKLNENYPNPFNPATKISFEIPEAGHVKLSVFDITGRLIKTIVNEFRNAGTYESTFDGSNLSSGFYFYKLESGNSVETRRMILLK